MSAFVSLEALERDPGALALRARHGTEPLFLRVPAGVETVRLAMALRGTGAVIRSGRYVEFPGGARVPILQERAGRPLRARRDIADRHRGGLESR